ncbi:MAG: radical SAM protein [Firmicutes bacterium]|nr:radical SAM protein [Bacillota bacterium]
MKNCILCPRECHTDRENGNKGFCGMSALPSAALVSKHMWEEPCISGENGSGTVFFSGCNLKCVFCQNFDISQEGNGKQISAERLAEIFIEQQNRGVHNINLVSAGHFIPAVKEALILAKEKGLAIPVVYNSNGYEKAEALKELEGLVDIYLPDIKYFSSDISKNFSFAENYFDVAINAVKEMYRQVGKNEFDENGMLKKGIIIRHLVLPSCRQDSKKILSAIKEIFGNNVYVSIMNQYTPMYKAKNMKPLNRRLTTFEYEDVIKYFFDIGLENGFMQSRLSATDAYTPKFDHSGI